MAKKDLSKLLKRADDLFERYDENGNYFGPQNSPTYISLTTGRPSQAVLMQINRATKEQRWHYVQGAPLFDEEGKVSMVLVTNTEITNQKNAEKKIRESEETFRTLSNSIPQLSWMADAEGFIYWYNKKWFEYTGTVLDDMKGWGWQSVHHPDELPKILESWRTSIKTGQPFEMTFPIKGADGIFRQFLTRVLPVYDSNGKIYKWVGTNTNINAQKLAEEAIKESEELCSSLANSIQNLAWIADADGWIYWYNQRWFNYTGTTLKDMQGWGWDKVHHPDHIEEVLNIVKEAWKKDEPYELTFPLRRYDGEYRWFLTRVVPIKDASGKVTKWIGFNLITFKK